MQDWIEKLFADPELLRMGHRQSREDLNLGLGWLYYALARILQPRCAVVIGSWRGFVPAVLARALLDNGAGGEVLFIDPSLADDFWRDPERVREHFAKLGVPNVRHLLMTTQEFAQSEAYRSLREVGIVFIDGFHSAEQARFDFETFERLLPERGMALFHDSMVSRVSRRYGDGGDYVYTVRDYIDALKERSDLQVYDFPFAEGVTLVGRVAVPEGRRGNSDGS